MKAISKAEAMSIALKALVVLVDHPAQLAVFLKESGLTPKDLRTRLEDEQFLGGLLDFFMEHSAMLSELIISTSLAPQTIMQARLRLPGADPAAWVMSS
jgi:hypothetical protein